MEDYPWEITLLSPEEEKAKEIKKPRKNPPQKGASPNKKLKEKKRDSAEPKEKPKDKKDALGKEKGKEKEKEKEKENEEKENEEKEKEKEKMDEQDREPEEEEEVKKARSSSPHTFNPHLIVPVPIFEMPTSQTGAELEETLKNLRSSCFQAPVALIRNLSDVTNFDLTSFSSSTLLRDFPDLEVDLRSQIPQHPDQNVEEGEEVWNCTSSVKKTTVAEYVRYQAGFLPGKKISKKNRAMIDFCTNIDLSDEARWTEQYKQIRKLPHFLQVNSPEDMLHQYDHVILGMNRAQMYLKVPSCRTPGHQENNNFCSVNLNLGPGDCEWFSVHTDYWRKIDELCRKNGVSFLKGSWWPNLKDLEKENIPYYRFTQKKGEIVYLNSGTVHWVQALGVCNNVAWNVGPPTANQLRQAIERYEDNLLEEYKSIVPMETLAWKLTNVETEDLEFYKELRKYLHTSLKVQRNEESQIMKRRLRIIPYTPHGPAIYCMHCQKETFNYIFVRDKEEGEQPTYCRQCATTALKGKPQVVFQRRLIRDLMAILDEFDDFLEQLGVKC